MLSPEEILREETEALDPPAQSNSKLTRKTRRLPVASTLGSAVDASVVWFGRWSCEVMF